jgi:hypothetical protein
MYGKFLAAWLFFSSIAVPKLNPDFAVRFVMRSSKAIQKRVSEHFLSEGIVNYFELKKCSESLLCEAFGLRNRISTAKFGLKNPDPIHWNSTRRLSWSDFKASPDSNSDNAALTSSTISFQFSLSGTQFKYSIACTFDRNASWGRVKTSYILLHEQAHFDISEIFARKLNKALRQYAVKEATISADVSAIYKQVMEAHAKYQQQYDDETSHSRLPDKQAAWLEKVNTELNGLEAYSGYNEK